jgi:hypothetical protein
MQKNESKIGDVILALKIVISKWRRFNCRGVYRNLCDYLVQAFLFKFEYELNSNVNHVATLLNTSKLRIWYARADFADVLVSVTKSIHLVNRFFAKNYVQNDDKPVSESEFDPDQDDLCSLFKDASYLQSQVSIRSKHGSNYFPMQKIKLINLLKHYFIFIIFIITLNIEEN